MWLPGQLATLGASSGDSDRADHDRAGRLNEGPEGPRKERQMDPEGTNAPDPGRRKEGDGMR